MEIVKLLPEMVLVTNLVVTELHPGVVNHTAIPPVVVVDKLIEMCRPIRVVYIIGSCRDPRNHSDGRRFDD